MTLWLHNLLVRLSWQHHILLFSSTEVYYGINGIFVPTRCLYATYSSPKKVTRAFSSAVEESASVQRADERQLTSSSVIKEPPKKNRKDHKSDRILQHQLCAQSPIKESSIWWMTEPPEATINSKIRGAAQYDLRVNTVCHELMSLSLSECDRVREIGWCMDHSCRTQGLTYDRHDYTCIEHE